MTDRLKDGGPAFPREYTHKGHSGMSLRDWFAGQALAGSLSNPNHTLGTVTFEMVSTDCYKWADAMLAARKGKPND
jgi:hypothetical protein